ncbi:MAG: EVE domain-containing protein [Phycisphaerales bacterium JB065]
MTTYLCKSEPDTYSYADLVREKETVWDGVANPQACIHIRAIKKGDEILIYHTGGEKRIAGLAVATSDPYPDPKRPDLTAKGDVKFPVFDIKPVKEATKTVTLKDIKADERFTDFVLVKQSRLSVMPVPKKIDTALRKLAGL